MAQQQQQGAGTLIVRVVANYAFSGTVWVVPGVYDAPSVARLPVSNQNPVSGAQLPAGIYHITLITTPFPNRILRGSQPFRISPGTRTEIIVEAQRDIAVATYASGGQQTQYQQQQQSGGTLLVVGRVPALRWYSARAIQITVRNRSGVVLSAWSMSGEEWFDRPGLPFGAGDQISITATAAMPLSVVSAEQATRGVGGTWFTSSTNLIHVSVILAEQAMQAYRGQQ